MKLQKGAQMRELEKEAMRVARAIEGKERGLRLHDNFDIDEETRFSSVYRGRGVDDSGYEDEEIVLDSCTIETFGGSSASVSSRPTDFTSLK
ncbi:hypothetical protein SLA2020_232400 [Shorea laevis]